MGNNLSFVEAIFEAKRGKKIKPVSFGSSYFQIVNGRLNYIDPTCYTMLPVEFNGARKELRLGKWEVKP